MWIKTQANTFEQASKVAFTESGRAVIHLSGHQRVFLDPEQADQLRLLLEEKALPPAWVKDEETLRRKAG